MRRLLISMAAFAAVVSAVAQEPGRPSVTAAFDRDSLFMGDRFDLDVRVVKDIMQVVDFPDFPTGEIAPGIEILDRSVLDTVAIDSRRHALGMRYHLVVWEAGDYRLGRFPALYADKNVVDTLWSSDSLRIRVATFDIDLAKDKPYDIKPPMDVPLLPGEFAGWLALALGVLAVVALALWLLVKYRRHIPLFGGSGPPLPAHVEAIRRLEALRNQKLPQNGRHKQYYSGITDILRTYFERRWGIGAMEMTSAEIVSALDVPHRAGDIDNKRYADLARLLAAADLVKFAKLVPGATDIEQAWYDAYYFVEETKATVEGRAEESEREI